MPFYFDQTQKQLIEGWISIDKEKGLQHKTYLTKINSQGMTDLNVKHKTIKLLEKRCKKIFRT